MAERAQEDPGAALARIEREVAGGATDLSALGFWGVVRRLKSDQELAAAHAEAAGRIDRAAFERAVRPRFPVWFGNTALFVSALIGAAALVYATLCDNATVAGILLVGAALVLSVTLHDLAHWAVGRAVGIRFLCYFLDGPFLVQPGLKTDYATYLRATPGARAWMHASGALASKAAPFVALAVWPASSAPGWAAWAVLAIGVVQIATDVLWSRKKSDWKRFARERRFASSG